MDFKQMYEEKKTSAVGIADLVQSGMHITSDIATSTPPTIMSAIAKTIVAKDLHDVRFETTLDIYPLDVYKDPEVMKRSQIGSWFCGGLARKAVAAGGCDVMTAYYYDCSRVIEDYMDYDLAVYTTSAMDENGYFSFGLAASCIVSEIKKSKMVCIEVNPNMPYIINGPKIHISEVAALCEANYPIPQLPKNELDETSKKIGAYIAEQIPDGATIQLGIGAVPDAVGSMLVDKKHLGIHTEMFTDSMVDLIECGAVDNSLKPINTGKSVTTFALGSNKMYKYLNNNPDVIIAPVEQVNRPSIISQHPNFMSINAALEVDFFGQVCAESIGTMVVSGTGGQVDYVRGAVESVGGKSFIAFPSTAQGGKVSRIKSILTPGAVVTTSKNDVDMIVTEYGIAKLRGQSLKQRTKNLIAVAHPDFREELTFEAKKRNILL